MWFLPFLQWWLSNVAYHFFISKNYSYAFLCTVCLRSAFFNRHKYSYTYSKLETNFIFLLFKTLYVFHRDVLEFINFIMKYSFYANYFGSALWRLTVECFIYCIVSLCVDTIESIEFLSIKQEPIVNCQNLCTNILYVLSYLNNRICLNWILTTKLHFSCKHIQTKLSSFFL